LEDRRIAWPASPNRLTAASGLAQSRAWTYDLNGNRKTAVTDSSTDTFTYDRTDQLLTVKRDAGSDVGFTYDAFGNVTTNAESISAVTTMTYDAASRLATIDASGTTNDTAFTYDGLARIRTRVINGTTDTYRYAGTSEAVAQIATGGGSTVDSLVDIAGTRMAVKSGGTLNWILPDLHGNVAGQLDSSGTSIAYATRYDPWGEVIDTGPGASTGTAGKTWTYQGRLDVSPAGINQPLLDGGARMYSPALGTFTSLDSFAGAAQDPLSMNRYLYAEGNPSTFIDPTGHACMRWIDDFCADKGLSSKARTKHFKHVDRAEKRLKQNQRIRSSQIENAYENHRKTASQKALDAALDAALRGRDTADREARESGALQSSRRLTVTPFAPPSSNQPDDPITPEPRPQAGFDPVTGVAPYVGEDPYSYAKGGKQFKRQTEWLGVPDDEILRRSKDPNLTPHEKLRLKQELKVRGLANKQKRSNFEVNLPAPPPEAIAFGISADGGLVMVWWAAKLLSPACGPFILICAAAL
jgi:RHS repeat-associated protein